MTVNKILNEFLDENQGQEISKAGDATQTLQITEQSKEKLLEKFLNEKKNNNYILIVIVLMFVAAFAIGCYLILYYRDQPETLKIVFGGTFLSVTTIIYGLQRVWRQKSYMDYLILLIQNLPADRVGEIIQTIIFEGKRQTMVKNP